MVSIAHCLLWLWQEAEHVPRAHALGGMALGCREAASHACPGLLMLLGGRERMNGLGCRAEEGREPWPDSLGLCAASLARPELFEAFCGGWLLLPPFPLPALSLSAQTGNLARILLPLHRQVWETVALSRECFERRGVHSYSLYIVPFTKTLGSPGLGALMGTMG